MSVPLLAGYRCMIEPVITLAPQASQTRWVVPFLAALVMILAVLSGPVSASAAATPRVETVVGASIQPAEVLVGLSQRIGAGQRLGEAGPQVVTTVTTGVAAETADVVVPDAWNAVTKTPSGGTVRDVGSQIGDNGLPSATRLAGMADDDLGCARLLGGRENAQREPPRRPDICAQQRDAPIRVQLSQQVIDAWGRK